MGKSHAKTTISSCLLATIFLTLVIAIALVLYFTLLKPHGPKLAVSAVTLPTFSPLSGGRNNSDSYNAVNFTLSVYAAVSNPNHAVFTHYDSSLELLYMGSRVGLLFVPAGKIGPGRTQYISATFRVGGLGVTPGGFGSGFELEIRLEMMGRVRVVRVFSSWVVGRMECRVVVGVRDGTVLDVHC